MPPERPSWGFEAAQDIAEHDDLGRLEAWLAEGIDFSVPLDMGATLMGATPMTILAGAGAASCVDRLLQVGVSPDEGTPPPVLAAAFGGHRHVLGLLVAAGADLGGEPYDEEFPTPLAAAVAAGDPKAVELLAAAGAVEASSLDTLEAALSHALALEPPKRGVMVPAVVRALAG